MKAVHYVMVVSGVLAAGLPTTATAFPHGAQPYFLAAAATSALVTMVCGALSPKVSGGQGGAS